MHDLVPTDVPEQIQRTQRVRRAYAPPKLTTYGSLRALTREIACSVNKDGGSNAICRRT
jgi:hypothetical protein